MDSSSMNPSTFSVDELEILQSHSRIMEQDLTRSDRSQDMAWRQQHQQHQGKQPVSQKYSLEKKDQGNAKPAPVRVVAEDTVAGNQEEEELSIAPPIIEDALETDTSTPSLREKIFPGISVSAVTIVTAATLALDTEDDDNSCHTHTSEGLPVKDKDDNINNNDSSNQDKDLSENSGPVDDIIFSRLELGYNVGDDGVGPDTLPVAPFEGEEKEDRDNDATKKPWMHMRGNERVTKKTPGGRRTVHFEYVEIREYAITIGDNPYCSRGPPITLDWEYSTGRLVPIALFESANKRRKRKNARRMLLDPIERRDLLWRCGHELEDIEAATKVNEKENFRQSINLYMLPVFVLQEIFESQSERFLRRGGKNQKTKESEKSSNEAQVRLLHRVQMASVDSEEGGLTPWQQEARHGMLERPVRRVSFRGSGVRLPSNSSVISTHSQSGQSDADVDAEWESAMSDHSSAHQHSDAGDKRSSVDSKFDSYGIRTDPRQHDKATEIILCSIKRPHMRAFHASWFGFFIGFIMWFAITPLLGEVKKTLNLTNAQIWTSSLSGTAVTVLARVLMGPLCDVFGARKCMAAIVVVSAIPCGLTGLVNTASGLAAVRAFIGIAGSAFVPCQYWTSRMFSREVAGTANALVAGWGNLGGGVTQLLMGVVLFPLFEKAFEDQDNAAELAWRTVFVIPAMIAFLAAYVYIYHCEDSPKGDFAELVRQQQIEIVSPFWSLAMAIQNRNVILLLLQYACCFGVEITMTNAIALYMKEEFGQNTASAAAIASIFGIMNLFARGLGGYGSDLCNSKFGTKGRVYWQAFTLFMEGIGIIVFAFASKLESAIFALIFCSLWVQCAEGSTYGIVPYVNRRFTGAVVGWIGGGGTMGGVIFSIFFREFSYKKAFITMGLAVVASSFLSIFMNMKSLADISYEKSHSEHIKNNNNFVFHDDAPARPEKSEELTK